MDATASLARDDKSVLQGFANSGTTKVRNGPLFSILCNAPETKWRRITRGKSLAFSNGSVDLIPPSRHCAQGLPIASYKFPLPSTARSVSGNSIEINVPLREIVSSIAHLRGCSHYTLRRAAADEPLPKPPWKKRTRSLPAWLKKYSP